MNHVSLCTKYYMNPQMLELQYRNWAGYDQLIKRQIEIIIVDDGSPGVRAEDVPRPGNLPPHRIYRIKQDKPWNQNGATNLGAFVAKHKWLLITDMDHMVNAELMEYCVRHNFAGKVFMFNRVDAPDMHPTLDKHGKPKPHPNSYLVQKQFYWDVGGHDEWYCGLYGTDRLLRQRFRDRVPIKQIELPLIRFERTVVPDASTTTLPRKEGRPVDFLAKRRAEKLKLMDEDKILTLQFDWEQVV